MQGLLGFLLSFVCIFNMAVAKADITDWFSYDEAKKQVYFKLTSAENANNNGLNYNGYYQGNLTLKVPVNWLVNISLTNRDANATHDIILTKPFGMDNVPDELTGESSIIKRAYIAPLFSNETDNLKFTAKTGQYWLFCGVKGHGIDGMWIKLDVDALLEVPAVDRR